MNIQVFLGPSLPLAEAKKILDGIYHPPVRMGDVYRLVESPQPPQAILIIDGFFEQTPAVWHKEILFALSKGIRVLGASSMGALRAAELHAFGMEGLGRIFADYASGRIEDDDEVAVVHGPAADGYSCQSEAMVNIRYGVQLALEQDVIDDNFAQLALAAAKAEYYPQRSWARLTEKLGVGLCDKNMLAQFAQFCAATDTNVKRMDARNALLVLAQSQPQPVKINFDFEPTVFWDHLTVYCGGLGYADEENLQFERLRNHVRLIAEDRRDIIEKALLQHLVTAEAKRLRRNRFNPRDALAHLRRNRKLLTSTQLQEWMLCNGINKEECMTLAQLEYTSHIIENLYAEQIDKNIRTALKRSDRFAQLSRDVKEKWSTLAQAGLDQTADYDASLMQDSLLWYQQEKGPITRSLAIHARETGFATERLFINELIAHYLYARHCGEGVGLSNAGATEEEIAAAEPTEKVA